jgi:hypothetical protein
VFDATGVMFNSEILNAMKEFTKANTTLHQGFLCGGCQWHVTGGHDSCLQVLGAQLCQFSDP